MCLPIADSTCVHAANRALADHQSTWGKTTAFLISIELAATAGAPKQKALILVFRGTEPFENLEVTWHPMSLFNPQHLKSMQQVYWVKCTQPLRNMPTKFWKASSSQMAAASQLINHKSCTDLLMAVLLTCHAGGLMCG